jgi:hypothetical protein
MGYKTNQEGVTELLDRGVRLHKQVYNGANSARMTYDEAVHAGSELNNIEETLKELNVFENLSFIHALS